MLKGNMLYGHNWSAGEFGHIPSSKMDPPALVGALGALRLGQAYLPWRHAASAIQEGSNSKRWNLPMEIPAKSTGWTVLSAANLGDRACSAIVEELEKHRGLGNSTLVNLLTPPS